MYDVIIIGSGPAGLSAAIYTTRYNLKTLVIGNTLGLITEAHKVENWPGNKIIHGFDLMQNFKEHAESLGAEIIMENVKQIKKENHFIVKTDSKEFNSKSIILALGTEKRKLNLKNEDEYIGRGVSYCATCDGPFFKNKITAVVGGGDGAIMSAHMLAQHCKKVYLIAREEKLNAKPGEIDELKKLSNVEILLKTYVTELIGNNKLEKIKTNNNEIILNGLFVEIGSTPSNLLTKQLSIDVTEHNYIKTNPDQSTNIEGIFAAGDITTNSNMMRQVITASAEGAIAANSVFKFVKRV